MLLWALTLMWTLTHWCEPSQTLLSSHTGENPHSLAWALPHWCEPSLTGVSLHSGLWDLTYYSDCQVYGKEYFSYSYWFQPTYCDRMCLLRETWLNADQWSTTLTTFPSGQMRGTQWGPPGSLSDRTKRPLPTTNLREIKFYFIKPLKCMNWLIEWFSYPQKTTTWFENIFGTQHFYGTLRMPTLHMSLLIRILHLLREKIYRM